eukprot:scaffold66645_cov60-Phaeocystis_antarctica.AAC.3
MEKASGPAKRSRPTYMSTPSPEGSKAVASAALEAAGSSTSGSSSAHNGRVSRPGCLEPPKATRRVLRRRGSRPRALPSAHFDHAALPATHGQGSTVWKKRAPRITASGVRSPEHSSNSTRTGSPSVGAEKSHTYEGRSNKQHQSVLRAATSFGQPRPSSRLGRAGRPHWPCFRHGPTRSAASRSRPLVGCPVRPARPQGSRARRAAATRTLPRQQTCRSHHPARTGVLSPGASCQ